MKKILFILFLLPLFVIGQPTTYDIARVKTNRVTIPKDSSLYLGTSTVIFDNTTVNFSAPIKMTSSNAIYFNTTGYFIAGVSNLLIYDSPASHYFRINGVYKFMFNAGDFSPYSDLLTELGLANARFGGLHSRNLTDTIGFTKFAAPVQFNSSYVGKTGAIANNDSVPSVAGANTFIYSGTANAVSIDALNNHVVGQYYTIFGNSNTYTITVVNGSVLGGDMFVLDGVLGNFVGGQYDNIVLYCYSADVFVEVSRQVF